MLRAVGREVGKMHTADIIHGDLTTSNMMVRLRPQAASGSPPFEVVRRSSTLLPPSPPSQLTRPTSLSRARTLPQVLIDFGLSSASPMHEDRAVDLYVLERAFSSTHPVPPGRRPHFDLVLEGYREALERGAKKGEWERLYKRLEEVRMRGRKRSMVG